MTERITTGHPAPAPFLFIVSRIFATLAFCVIVLMAVTVVLGLNLQKNDLVDRVRAADRKIDQLAKSMSDGGSAQELETLRTDRSAALNMLRDEQSSGSVHLLTGVAAVLAIVLVCSIAVTYFIGTSRWCREVVETYSLNDAFIRESQTLKRRSFPWAMIAMLTAVTVSALGARSDPGTGFANSAAWVTPHLVAAFLGLAVVSFCFVMLWLRLVDNQLLIHRLMQQVHDVRVARGLET
ncbi:MAG: hypothetical protein WBF93_18465 [Pirellulales bacterium]